MKKTINLFLIVLLVGACSTIDNKIDLLKKDQNKTIETTTIPKPIESNNKMEPSVLPMPTANVIESSNKPIINEKEKSITLVNTKVGEAEALLPKNTLITIAESTPNTSNAIITTVTSIELPYPSPPNCKELKPIPYFVIKENMPTSYYVETANMREWYRGGEINLHTSVDYLIRYDEKNNKFFSVNCYDVSYLNNWVNEYSIKKIHYSKRAENYSDYYSNLFNATFRINLQENNLLDANPKEMMDNLFKSKLLYLSYDLSSKDIFQESALEREEEIASALCREKINEIHTFQEIPEEKTVIAKIVIPAEYKIRYDLKRNKFYSIACSEKYPKIASLCVALNRGNLYNIEGLSEEQSSTESYNTYYIGDIQPEREMFRSSFMQGIKDLISDNALTNYQIYDKAVKIKVKKAIPLS
ncbi:MAG: hypothetical protein AABZ74_10190 [Cyanobacteriota bacterium]